MALPLANGTVYQDHLNSCTVTTLTYRRKLSSDDSNVVSKEFATAVCNLPTTLDGATEELYYQFIDEWGTVNSYTSVNTRNQRRHIPYYNLTL